MGTAAPPPALPKAPTGIVGLDEITGGGVPRGRPRLVSGGAGAGKTLLAIEADLVGAPTLSKSLPLPLQRFIGDMSRSEQVLVALDIVSS